MRYLLVNLVGSVAFFGVLAAGLVFGLAGRWDLWNTWAYVGIVVVSLSFQTLVVYHKNPDVLKERMEPGTRGRDLPLIIGYNVMFILHWSIAGLDQRFHWSDFVPLAGVVAGLVMVAIGMGLFTWAFLANPFFSSVARIQVDRGQQVIRAGPYAIMRHPGYAGVLLYLVAGGLALNSLLSIIPAVIGGAIFVRRTIIEDQMLQNELAGYADYAAKVRYRLIPGIW
jgi:protein-S-isoprenylcysteine O-methyltransferase Ste14